MMLRITKPFLPFTREEIDKLDAHTGVYELADDQARVIFVGYAGGKSRFGLRGELDAMLDKSSATGFRTEVNTAYLTRYQELLMVHVADHGALPQEMSEAAVPRLGRLSPN